MKKRHANRHGKQLKTVMTLRIDPGVKKALKKRARKLKTTPSFLASQLIASLYGEAPNTAA